MERERGHTSEVKGQGSMQLTFKKELVQKKKINKQQNRVKIILREAMKGREEKQRHLFKVKVMGLITVSQGRTTACVGTAGKTGVHSCTLHLQAQHL